MPPVMLHREILAPSDLRAAHSVELDACVDALQSPLAGEGVGEAFAGLLFGSGVDEDAFGASDGGDAAGEIDRTPVVIARLGQCGSVGDAGAQDGELLAFPLGEL